MYKNIIEETTNCLSKRSNFNFKINKKKKHLGKMIISNGFRV